jgi:4-diphosphocytidyl-2-C-methyl-D-erythritol kinase
VTLAPAKVNLVLRVGAPREDGYHDVASLLVALDVGDEVDVLPAPATSVHAPGLSAGDTLVTRALEVLARRAGHDGGFSVRVDKRIPVGAGLGGGSSDAGTALRLANALLGEPLDEAGLMQVAAAVGSDVPFFASGATAAVATGRGEALRPAAPPARFAVALAWPGQPVSTGEVYGRYRPAWNDAGFARAAAGVGLAARADLRTLAALVANDLGPAAEEACPASAALRRALSARGALAAAVSGSGSAVFGLFGSLDDARAALEGLPGAAWAAAASPLPAGTMRA